VCSDNFALWRLETKYRLLRSSPAGCGARPRCALTPHAIFVMPRAPFGTYNMRLSGSGLSPPLTQIFSLRSKTSLSLGVKLNKISISLTGEFPTTDAKNAVIFIYPLRLRNNKSVDMNHESSLHNNGFKLLKPLLRFKMRTTSLTDTKRERERERALIS
jgi:hypothetical protein